MARDPGSMWSPLAEAGNQGDSVKDKFIVHSTGDRGSALAIYNYFNRPDVVVESTFVVGLSAADPTRQLLNSSEVADANVGANVTGISVEVVGKASDPYTDWQVSELIRLGRWARTQHPIPACVCPSPTGAGFGWHVMFGAPGPWAAVAKECPGQPRIAALQAVIFPAIFGAATAPLSPPLLEDDMPYMLHDKTGNLYFCGPGFAEHVKDPADDKELRQYEKLPVYDLSDELAARVVARINVKK